MTTRTDNIRRREEIGEREIDMCLNFWDTIVRCKETMCVVCKKVSVLFTREENLEASERYEQHILSSLISELTKHTRIMNVSREREIHT